MMLVAVMVVGLSTVCLPVANAYVDPGSGSFVFQALIAGLLAAGMAIKVSRKRIVGFFARKPTGDEG